MILNKEGISTFKGDEVFTILHTQEDKFQNEFKLKESEWWKIRHSHKRKDVVRARHLKEDMDSLQSQMFCLRKLMDDIFPFTADDCNKATDAIWDKRKNEWGEEE
tara:strand:- start:362 stop:676 length:315 start_codon:yes stop_codon:yes gene_type:complete